MTRQGPGKPAPGGVGSSGQEATAARPIADAEDRRLIAEALDTTLVVEAAAGTGKTTELVRRIVRLIETGRAAIEQIVAVTFSEKAAGELKLRLREELERARIAAASGRSDELARLEAAVARFEESHVSTIHGFCADLLRERPVEAAIDPAFEVLTEGQSQRLWDEAFADWIQRELDAPSEGIQRSLRRESKRNFGQDDDEAGPIERLKKAGAELLQWRDHPQRWARPEAFDRRATIDRLIDALATFVQLSARPTSTSDLVYRQTHPLRIAWGDIHGQRARGHADYDGWEATLCALANKAGDLRRGSNRSGQYKKDVAREHVVEARDMLVAALVNFREVADADLAALVHEALKEAIALYEDRKTRRGVLDFLDLLIRARDLVRDDPGVRRDFQQRFRYLLVDEFQDTDPLQAELLLWLASDDSDGVGPNLEVRPEQLRDGGAGLHGRPDDHDPFDIPARPGALFIVGDPKQSIYRFRRADVGVYRDICDRLVARGARRVRLRTSFRSVPAIQRAVNLAFATHMTGDETTLQASYVELQPDRADHAGQPAVVALPVPRPLSRSGNVTQGAIKLSLPEATGEFVRWLVQDSGWTVPGDDPEGPPRRAVRAGDVCLLFRRFIDYQDDVTRDYVDALESRGLTHLLVGGKAFHEREEVDAIRTALTAIEWPDDQLSVFATLRGPFLALGEEELLAWHHWKRGFRPFDAGGDPPHEALRPVAEALTLLRDLNRQRNHRPVAETITRLMEATRAHAAFTLWRGGEQVLANVLQIAEMARQYEAEGGLSFRGFVDDLRDAADRAPTPEAPILEEGTDGVRLMTVHKAKGLEFPVVVLADIGCKLSRDEASRHLDSKRRLAAIKLAGWSPLDLRSNNALEASRDAAEGVRLAYVAATRARDLLVVPAIGDAPYERGWCDPLDVAIRPAAPASVTSATPVSSSTGTSTSAAPDATPERSNFSSTEGGSSRLPRFPGKDTVLDRPDGETIKATTVRPGVYSFRDPATHGAYDVVWWDPLLLDRRGEEKRGLRNEHLIAKDVDPREVAAARERYDAWVRWRADAIARGSVPSLRVMTVTEWAHAVIEAGANALTTAAIERAAATVEVIEAGVIDSARPSGARFGILVHAILAAVGLDASPDQVAQLAAAQARMLNAGDGERAAAADIAHRVLRHPLLDGARAALAAGRTSRREVALSVMVHETLIDGQADLVYDTGRQWVVVDFKTDVAIAAAQPVYARQLALYSLALPPREAPPRLCLLRV